MDEQFRNKLLLIKADDLEGTLPMDGPTFSYITRVIFGAKEHGRDFLCHPGILTPKKAIIPALEVFSSCLPTGQNISGYLTWYLHRMYSIHLRKARILKNGAIFSQQFIKYLRHGAIIFHDRRKQRRRRSFLGPKSTMFCE